MNTEIYRRSYNSLDDSIKDANNIWKMYVCHVKEDVKFRNKSRENRLSVYQKKYPKFHHNYPIMLRYMIAFEWYYVKAFRRYIKKLQTTPVKSMDEKLERDAEYVKFLYREECKKQGKSYDAKHADKLKTDIYTALKTEKDEFEKNYKESQQEVDKFVDLNQKEKRDRLIEFLKRKSEEKK
jgi:hypothetical protein